MGITTKMKERIDFTVLEDCCTEADSTPLQPKGTDVKFPGKPCEKVSGTEGQTVFVQLDVEGTPPPSVAWFKGFKDLAMEQRTKAYTDGATGQVVLGIENLKQEDEGAYRCVLNEEIEHEFSVYVTVEGGMDFRAMLMKKK